MRAVAILLLVLSEFLAMGALLRAGGWLLLLGWLFLAGLLGVTCLRLLGFQTLRGIQLSLARQELPALPLWEGAVGLVGALLLILPGPLGDLLAVPLLLPATRRRLARELQQRYARRHPQARGPVILEGEFRETPPPPRDRLPPSG